MGEHTDNGLVKPVRPPRMPSRKYLNVLRWISVLLVLYTPICLFLYSQHVVRDDALSDFLGGPIPVLGSFAGGIILFGVQSFQRKKYYRTVTQGRVLKHEFEANTFGDRHYLDVRGYNNAGEIIEAELVRVDAKTYTQTNDGDLVVLPDEYA